jgi:hypothetical protein
MNARMDYDEMLRVLYCNKGEYIGFAMGIPDFRRASRGAQCMSLLPATHARAPAPIHSRSAASRAA